MATYRKVGKRWQAVIRKRGYSPQSKTFSQKTDAKAWATTLESEMDRGHFQDRSKADRMTLDEGLGKYLKEVTPRKKGAKQEQVRIAYWRSHKLSKTSISRVAPKDLAEWRDEMLEAGKSPSTINNSLNLLSHFFNHARKEWSMPVSNPVEGIWRPKQRQGRKRRLGDDETALLDAAKEIDPLLPQAIEFAIETGMRRGEIIGMRKDHIRESFVHIPEAKNDEGRDVPLSPRAKSILESLPSRIDGKIWPWRSADTLTHRFTEAVQQAGIEDLHFHDLRHEATTRLAKIYPVHELARITGHKTLGMLMRYYHPTADELAEKMCQPSSVVPSQ